MFHEVSSSRCQIRLPPSGDRFAGKVCLIHLNCIIRLELEAMGQKTRYVKGVFLVIIRCVAVEGMLGEIIFVGQKRTDAAKLQDTLAAIQHGKLIHAHQLFATKSSGEFPKGKRHKRNPSFISLAFLFCFDIIYGITFNLGQKKAGNLFRFPA